MRGFCGWFARRSADGAGASMQASLAALSVDTTSREHHWAGEQAGMAILGGVPAPTLHRLDGFTALIVGHPRMRSHATGRTGASTLVQALRERGVDALKDIEGAFAIATWNAARRSGFVAVDRMGIQRLVYGPTPDGLAYASSLDLLGALPGIERRLSRQALFDYVFQHVTPGPRTVFEGLRSLPPGHAIEFGERGASSPLAYWSLRFDENDRRSFDDLKADFVGIIRTAVSECAAGANAGAFLSGGTDSSTVSGMLTQVGGRPAQTFSIGFDAAGYDEMEYARIAAKHFGCEHHEYYVTPADVVQTVGLIAQTYDQPFGNASAVPTYHCARFAREHGIERMLAGDGGDELFGGNERYAKHHLLGLYQNVPAPLRRLVVEPLLTPEALGSLPLLRKLRSYVLQARPPMPRRYASSSQLAHLGATKVFADDFLAGIDIDHPGKLLDDAGAPFADASLINQMLGIDMRFILADGDLPKVTRMCEAAGVDVVFPLLDDRLVEFSCHLPADLKLRGRALRWFFKQALSDFLPPAIITKQKHGFGLPVGDWIVGHKPLADIAADSVASLRQRGILRADFVDELFDKRLAEHAPYFGGLAWVLMMLGLWMDSRKVSL